MDKKIIDVTGIGNAIVDVLSDVKDVFLKDLGLKKGSMVLVDREKAEKIYSKITSKEEISGGSAANTIAALAHLGNLVAFIGKVGEDILGDTFKANLSSCGVQCFTEKHSDALSTGRCIILVTPDAQRTMCTSLGIAGSLEEKDINIDIIKDSRMLYIEGYLWDREIAKKAIIKAIKTAKESDCKFAFSLSDSFCVERHRQDFLSLIKYDADIVFANEGEINSVFKVHDVEDAISCCQKTDTIFAITRGEKGSVIVNHEQVIRVKAIKPEKLVDTTGAGDLYAAGFLHGYLAEKNLDICGQIGSWLASEIISSYGARLQKKDNNFLNLLNKLA